MSSPIIVTMMGEPSGKPEGENGKVRAAFAHYEEWAA